MLDLRPNEASNLLRHYMWKNSQLQSDWFANQLTVREKVGISASRPAAPVGPLVQCSSAFCDAVSHDAVSIDSNQ